VTIAPFNGIHPRIHPSAFIAPGCRIIGDVEIGPDASVWYNCVIRADVATSASARSNIQDGTVIHCESQTAAAPMVSHHHRRGCAGRPYGDDPWLHA
jgi:carbonic anhydrase/acetyltransferase-like protein (isoleucine patch superfamily)